MSTPLIVYVSSATQALPAVVVVATWGRRPPAPMSRLSIFSLFLVLSDVFLLIARALFGDNHWVTWITEPMEVGLTIWLLACWQPWKRAAPWYRAAPVVVLIATALALLITNPADEFDKWIGPAMGLVALVATLHTGVHRALRAITVLPGEPWFWICSGLALFWLGYIPVDAFAMNYLHSKPAWSVIAYVTRSSLLPIPILLLAIGAWLGRPREIGSRLEPRAAAAT